MPQRFPWKRFWCNREASVSLSDRGFLFDPEAEHGATINPNLRTLDQLQATPGLALLGEPGIGKSWSLETDVDGFMERTPDLANLRLDLRGFGSEQRLYTALFESPVFTRWAPGDYDLHLYLDSFDECLLRIETVASMLADELPKYPLSRLKLRIACRTASWPPVLERALKKGYGEQNFAAAELVPLRRKDVLEAAGATGLEDPAAFVGRIEQLQITALAIKPITLTMLLNTFQREGDLPTNLLDLYEKGCLILCEELNESRRGARRIGALSPATRLAVASRIAAVTQLGNRFAVWKGTELAGAPIEDVSISSMVGGTESGEQTTEVTNDVIAEVLGTGLFSSRGEERLGWSHQTFAEFLAARYCIAGPLSIEQLRSLIFHPRRERVIPQIREVASWLAIQHDELFLEIAQHDPEVLLGSASPSLSPHQRSLLTAALLRACNDSRIGHLNPNLELRNLAHPAIADQLRPYLENRARPSSTRYLAGLMARACKVPELGEVLLAIALSNEEGHDFRSLAAHGVADGGSEEEREQLRPLLTLNREEDPNEQLRGCALDAIYAGDKYDDELWSHLEHPREPLFFGAYNLFLTYFVLPKLNCTNLPAALRWCAQQPIDDIGVVSELEADIYALAVKQVDVPEIAEELAKSMLVRCKAHHGFPNRGGSKMRAAQGILLEDDTKRRQFLAAFLALPDPERVRYLNYPLCLVTHVDLHWFIDRVVNGTSRDPMVEAEAVQRLAFSWDSDTLISIWTACQVSEAVAAVCSDLFEPVALDSEQAKWARGATQARTMRVELETAPPMKPRVEAALLESESGTVDAWLNLLYELSMDEGATSGPELQDMEVLELPGWVSADGQTRRRILEAAKRYLDLSTFPELEPLPLGKVRCGALAAINALWLLHASEPDYLQAQPNTFYKRWAPSFLEDLRAGEEKEPGIEAAFRAAAAAAPEVIDEFLLNEIRREDAGGHKYLTCSTLLDRAWSDSLALTLLAEAKDNDWTAEIQGVLLSKLLTKDTPGAREWAEDAIRNEPASTLGLILSRVLLGAGEDRAWPIIWPLVEQNREYGRALFEGFGFGRSESYGFGSRLSTSELGDLYTWLAEQYPVASDRRAAGAIGPLDTVRFIRDGALEMLKKRGTFEACDVLATIALRLPDYGWMRYHYDEAERLACAVTWEPPSAKTILAMRAYREKRFVESSQQLLALLVESLQRLQAELHGELGALVDLWNSQGKEWWPKQEEEISDYVARFLRRDLSDRAIILNREVQIRRGRAGEMPGQSTDVHVDAVVPANEPASRYGFVSVIIEVKGTWNAGLITDMEVQLRNRYLRNNDCQTGLYLAAHFSANAWRRGDNRRAQSEHHQLNDLRAVLQEQAHSLSGGVLIEAFVLDVSLDSTRVALGNF